MSEVSAYEKMLQDGSAFKKIDMNKIAAQEYAKAGMSTGSGGGDIDIPLGEPAPMREDSNMEEDHTDWSAVDEAMERRVKSLRNKMNGSKGNTKIGKVMTPAQREIEALKKRVAKLEEALITIMEVHEQLFED